MRSDYHLPGDVPESRAQAAALDVGHPVAALRDRFVLPDGVVYLDGNSLGALPASTAARIAHTVTHEWGQRLIRSWNEAQWFTASERIARALAPWLGAHPDEVMVADSTSVNLFKLLVAATRLRPDRRRIVLDRHDFPTDVYIGRSVAELTGRELQLVDGPDDLAAALGPDVAVVALSEVDFRTGRRRDMAAGTAAAHEHGALALWDLSHSAGALDVDLTAADADLAVGCGYKYLNGGPGAPAYAVVARRHHHALQTPLPGWMGHAAPFAMDPEYHPAAGVGQLRAGTPPILSLVALEEGIAALDGVTPADLRARGIVLTELFRALIDRRCAEHGLRVASPVDPAQRGSQLSVHHPQAHALVQALIARDVIGDFREPDIARFGFAPAYVTAVDVWDAVERMRLILDSGEHHDPRFAARAAVT